MELTDDIKPIYLGYEKEHRKYHFYFIKEGVPRFLVYVTYFYWDRGPQTILSLIPVPTEVEDELGQFLSGNLSYEFSKRRKNSKSKTVNKLYRLPQQVGQTDSRLVGRTDSEGHDGIPLPGISCSRNETANGNVNGIKVIKTKKKVEVVEPLLKLKRKRRTNAEMEELKKLPVVMVADVKPVKEVAHETSKRRSKP